MDARVPGGNKAVLAEQEPEFDDSDDNAATADDSRDTGSRPTSQSLPRSCRLLQPSATNGGLSPAARKVLNSPT